MHITKLNINEFTEFQLHHSLSSYMQTISYGMLMAENGFDYDLIGYIDEERKIYAASLIILKHINNKFSYGYAPKGFLIDYSNTILLNRFTNDLKEWYGKKSVTFIKINPEIAIGEIELKTFKTNYNVNKELVNNLINAGYKKLIDNLYFEAMLPRFNGFIKCDGFDINNLTKNTKNKIKKGIRKGLIFEKVNKEYLNTFYEFIKYKKDHTENYYKDLFTVYNKSNDVDLFLVKINYQEFLINSQSSYENELKNNNYLNELLIKSNNSKTINKKMCSDRSLLTYKNDILEATKGMQEDKNEYIAGAIVVKHNNKAYILLSGYNTLYKRFVPNYFLHYNIIKYYTNICDFIDLNGMTGDFTESNPYDGLNRFKLGFKPRVYEFIGEFDLVIDDNNYKNMIKSGLLAKEFNKK